jgi:hypothetical protein
MDNQSVLLSHPHPGASSLSVHGTLSDCGWTFLSAFVMLQTAHLLAHMSPFSLDQALSLLDDSHQRPFGPSRSHRITMELRGVAKFYHNHELVAFVKADCSEKEYDMSVIRLWIPEAAKRHARTCNHVALITTLLAALGQPAQASIGS